MKRVVRAFSLIEVLVVVALLMVAAAFLLPRLLGGKTPDGKTVRAPITVAKDTVCQSNIRQVRQSIDMGRMAGDGESGYPASLQALKLPSEMLRCEVGGEPYQYNPQTGKVRCPHPGHQNF